MKRLTRVFFTLLAVIIACACTFTIVGCNKEDIRRVRLNIAIYNYDEDNPAVENYTMDIDLYGHFAPKTVDAIEKYVKGKYYNDTVFYKLDSYSSQIMVGDLKFDSAKVENLGFYLNAEKPKLDGEFTKGGVVSNLKVKKGSIGLWRSWYAQDGSYTYANATDSGRATWFIPTSSISAYDDNFCVFAQFDVNASNNKKTLTALNNAMSSENYAEYEIYYTGDVGEDNDYSKLTFNCVLEEEFDEDAIENLFTPEDDQLMSYAHYTVNVPVYTEGTETFIAAKIVSAKIVED